ncbi:MAG: pirin family protein [Pseudomonadota bacterium]
MLTIRKSGDRGYVRLSWLESRHTFSFGDYYDPEHMGFSVLRVINEDHIAAGGGFGTHGHQDMEIITFMVAGALEHQDSLGNGSVIKPGIIQRMSAGTGIRHSEFNHSQKEKAHLLQIWLLPDRRGVKPGYEDRHFEQLDQPNVLHLVVSPTGEQNSLAIHQDVKLYSAKIYQEKFNIPLQKNRSYWLQCVAGSSYAGDVKISAGDALAISNEQEMQLANNQGFEFLFFDMPPD